MFRTVPLSIIGSFSLYTQQWYMSYRFADSLLSAKLYALLCVQWKTADDGQRNCPKHVEFYSKNKFEKSVHIVDLIIRIYHDARPPEPHISLLLFNAPSDVRTFCARTHYSFSLPTLAEIRHGPSISSVRSVTFPTMTWWNTIVLAYTINN